MPYFETCSIIHAASAVEYLARSVGICIMSLVHDAALSSCGWIALGRGGLVPAPSRLSDALTRLIDERFALAERGKTDSSGTKKA